MCLQLKLLLREGLKLAKSPSLNHVITETDSQVFVSLWRSKEENRASITPILKQTAELSRSFLCFTVNHVKRDENMAAHIAAKSASITNPVCVWHDQVPEFLAMCIHLDCNFAYISI
jgi:hypothetical protein